MKNLSSKYGFGPVILLYSLAVVLVWPFAEFPVNDDWAYAQAALNFSDGIWHYTDWQGMPLFSQALYGALWIKIFGFSFAALKVSMMCVALLGAYYVYRVVLDATANHRASLMASLVMLFNPLVFHLSLSFMTDLFALTCMLGAYFYLQRLSKSKAVQLKYLIPAVLFLLVGVLCRQTVLVVPLGFVIYEFVLGLKTKRFNKSILIQNLAATIVCFVIIIFHDMLYLNYQDALPANYGFQFSVIANAWTSNESWPLGFLSFLYYMAGVLIFVGIALAPITVCSWRFISMRERIVFILFAAFFVLRVILSPNEWPFTGDVWHPKGIGAELFESANSNLYVAHPAIGSVLSLFAALSLAKISTYLKFVPAVCIAFLSVVPASVNYLSDRYFIVPMAFLLVTIVPFFLSVPKRHYWLTVPIIVMIIYSIQEQHYFHRNRFAAAELVKRAEKQDLHLINYGFEWNGWTNFSFERYNPYSPERAFVGNYEYCISPADTVDGFIGISEVRYADLFGLRRKRFRIWKRVDRNTENSIRKPDVH